MSNITDMMSNAVPDSSQQKEAEAILSRVKEDNPALCIQCGKCTSGCEAFKLSELEPHKVMSLFKLGLFGELTSSEEIWTCMSCLKCKERCPQNLSPADTIVSIKNIAVMAGASVPDGVSVQLNSLLENGLIQAPVEVNSRDGRTWTRESLDLPPAPRPKNMEVFTNILMNATGELLK